MGLPEPRRTAGDGMTGPDPRQKGPAMTVEPLDAPQQDSSPARPTRQVFVRDLVVECLIGVYRHGYVLF